MKPNAQSTTASLLLLHPQGALVSLIQDTLGTPSCVLHWAMSEPWRAGVMPAHYLCDSDRDELGSFPKGYTGSADDGNLNGWGSFEADTNCPSLTHMKLVQAQRRMISQKLMPAVC